MAHAGAGYLGISGQLRPEINALRPSIPVFLSMVIAVAGVIGFVVVAAATDVGTAPGSGQQTFDAPGCKPDIYAGPGRTPHYLLGRNCPTPTAVIIRQASPEGQDWNIALDGAQSFDPTGGNLTKFAWSLDGGPQRPGMSILFRNVPPGLHEVVLFVTSDSGLTGTEKQMVRLP